MKHPRAHALDRRWDSNVQRMAASLNLPPHEVLQVAITLLHLILYAPALDDPVLQVFITTVRAHRAPHDDIGPLTEGDTA